MSDALKLRFLKRRFREYKRSAKRRGKPFYLSYEEFKKIIFKSCTYCGDTPERGTRKEPGSKLVAINGIDRVDSNIGYQIKNCVPACSVCNYMKGTLSKEDFIDKVKEIHEFFTIEIEDTRDILED